MSKICAVGIDMMIDGILSLPDYFKYTLEELQNMSDEKLTELDNQVYNIKSCYEFI
jgi:hypothetical protein